MHAVAEDGLWEDATPRTTTVEMAGLIGAGEIAVARLGVRIVGTVRIQRLNAGVGEVGMLVADPAHRGTGIGGALIRFAERWCAQQGLDTVQREVLGPRNWTHPSKEGLKDWYSRLGYPPRAILRDRRALPRARAPTRDTV